MRLQQTKEERPRKEKYMTGIWMKPVDRWIGAHAATITFIWKTDLACVIFELVWKSIWSKCLGFDLRQKKHGFVNKNSKNVVLAKISNSSHANA